MPHADDLHLEPLSTDAAILDRAASIVGLAQERQLWLLLVDEHDVQLPIVLPIGGTPVSPDADAVRLFAMLARVAAESGAAWSMLVLERPGPVTATPDDLAWAHAAHCGFDDERVELRSVLVSHDAGVALLDAA